MKDDYLKEISSDSEIIAHYDLLNRIGIWSKIEKLSGEIHNLEELLEEAVNLFNKHTVQDLIEDIINRLLNKFIPSYMAFIIQEEFDPDSAYIVCYKNLKPIEKIINIKSLEPYKKFFALSPSPTTFDVFEYMIEDRKLTDVFQPLNPKIIVPMMGKEGMYGFIVFGQKVLGNKYLEGEIRYIDRIMKFASISLQNNIHYRRAIIDAKTKLYNHSFFLRRFEEEISKIKRYNFQLCLLMVDIDYFKRFNDTYGHVLGDKLLYNISNIINENVRDEDVASRFGGEEFAILLIQCDITSAWVVAERIRKAIEKFKMKYDNEDIHVTVSVGIAHARQGMKLAVEDIIKHADDALYQSKENGRNKTSIYSS